ncbi:DUF1490 family protein [Natroniella acetigena]|uniref:DUF1490 family protein n=1 Tax=Natroniella acetigena TaxID=52004 RepID=UPI002009F162|nr:DUF1490 family protein [Natroniella acetigena]MCK8826659.1 DUF1490 family protein [Natroniella acetigena]
MIPLGIVYGVATFCGLKKLKRPIRKAAVSTTSQVFSAVDVTKEAAYSFKEEVEDIIAEAQYENMKRKQNTFEEDFNLEEELMGEEFSTELIEASDQNILEGKELE